MKKIIFFLVILFNFCFLVNPLCAQQTMQFLLTENQQKLTGLSLKFRNNKELALLDQSNSTAKLLKDFATRLVGTNVAARDYWGVVTNYNRLIRRISEGLDSSQTAKTLDFISNDISFKLTTGSDQKKEVSGTVEVIVKVVDSASLEQSGYDVSVRYYLALDETFTEQFNPTNHAQKDILPGWYLVRVSKNGNVIAERSEFVRVNTDNTFIFTIMP